MLRFTECPRDVFTDCWFPKVSAKILCFEDFIPPEQTTGHRIDFRRQDVVMDLFARGKNMDEVCRCVGYLSDSDLPKREEWFTSQEIDGLKISFLKGIEEMAEASPLFYEGPVVISPWQVLKMNLSRLFGGRVGEWNYAWEYPSSVYVEEKEHVYAGYFHPSFTTIELNGILAILSRMAENFKVLPKEVT